RMTAPIVAAGSVAKTILASLGVRVVAYAQAIGNAVDEESHSFDDLVSSTRQNTIRAASASAARRMRAEILAAKEVGDSVGGVVKCVAIGLPVGVGEPFFDTVEGELSKFLFAIPAVKGVEFGAGFNAARMRGSEHNDPYVLVDGKVMTETNNAGGVLGGLTNGMPLEFKVAFKPTASISAEQRSVDLKEMKVATLKIEGRHDPCIVPRAVAVVEGATAFVLADLCKRGGFLG
ncbi:MAG: chorismate synthase, partial [Methanomassiliicoccales archaeon]|nr:chorismate synthase [Methanomassiliicoccales archaeon]